MSRGLGKVQKIILERLSGYGVNHMNAVGYSQLLSTAELYYDVEYTHWGDNIHPVRSYDDIVGDGFSLND